MKFLSRRNILIVVVVAAVVANVLFRLWSAEPQPRKAGGPPKKGGTPPETVVPSLAGLASMGRDWEDHIAALPPEERPAAQARLDEEKKFFMQAMLLPAAEREAKMKEHLAALMNDPEMQAVMMEQRTKRFTKMDAAERTKMLRGYVNYKSGVTGK